MYSPKIYPEQVEKMYKIRCVYAAIGENKPMTSMVAEALELYLPKKLREVNKKAIDAGLVIIPAIRR